MTVGNSSSILSDLVNLSAAADSIIVKATSENVQCDLWIAKGKTFVDETWSSINACNENINDISVSKFPKLSDFIGKVPTIVLPNLKVISHFFESKSVSKITPKAVNGDEANTILQNFENKIQENASSVKKSSKLKELLPCNSGTGKTNANRTTDTQLNSIKKIVHDQENYGKKLKETSAKSSVEELGIKPKCSNKIKFDDVPSVDKKIKKSNPSNKPFTRSKSSHKRKSEENESPSDEKFKTPKLNREHTRQSKRFRTPKADEETNTLKKRKIYETPEFSRKPENKISSITVNPMVSNCFSSATVKTSAVFLNPTNLNSMMLKNLQNEKENSTKKAMKKKTESEDLNTRKEKIKMKLKQEANEKKQKREEKMERTQQKRLKLEKEREERVKQRESKKAVKINDKVKESGKKAKISRAASNLGHHPNTASKVTSSTPVPKSVKEAVKTPHPSNKATSNLLSKELSVKEVIKVAQNQTIVLSVSPPVLNDTYVLADEQGDVIKQGSSEKTKSVLNPLNTNIIQGHQQNSGSDAKKHEKEPTKSMNETFCKQKTFNNYEMTPPVHTEFSSYDISDVKSDDESDSETSSNKPIPSWAQGMRLKNALYQKHYKESDSDVVFGTVIDMPNLDEIFGVIKKKYMHRSSSAVWHNTPERF